MSRPQTVGGGWVYFDYRKSMKKCHHGLTMLQRFLDNKKLLLSFPYNSIGLPEFDTLVEHFYETHQNEKLNLSRVNMVPTSSQPMS